MLGLVRRIRRRRLVRRPLPEPWTGFLERHVPFYAQLSAPDEKRFIDQLKVFVWEKSFIGAGGMEITEEVKVVIAASAVRLTVHLGIEYYDRLSEVIVYPSAFINPNDPDSVVLGEAHSWGTVVLAWDAVISGLHNPTDGHDTATHEFAHVLDRNDGAFDGTPELRKLNHYGRWAHVMSQHYDALRGGKRRLRKVMRNYGAQNEAEFFAVASESFFEKPSQMKARTPELYEELKRFYGWDPAADQDA
jgi:Mlc titration factor MtfA (ptsG expression regulator)